MSSDDRVHEVRPATRAPAWDSRSLSGDATASRCAMRGNPKPMKMDLQVLGWADAGPAVIATLRNAAIGYHRFTGETHLAASQARQPPSTRPCHHRDTK